jgi:hypothetical protein
MMNEGDASGYRRRATGDRGNIGHGTELGSWTVDRNQRRQYREQHSLEMLRIDALCVAVALIVAGPRWVRTFTAGT